MTTPLVELRDATRGFSVHYEDREIAAATPEPILAARDAMREILGKKRTFALRFAGCQPFTEIRT